MGEKDDGPVTVVLKLDLHCEGCATKVKRSIRHFEGVHKVKTDSANNKLTVTGNVDPERLRERVEYKTKTKVEILSPKKDSGGDKKSDDKPEKKAEEKKPKEVSFSTVVMKIRLHCDGCIHRIKKMISKIDGVDKVHMDAKNDLVTVKGTMEVKELVPYLKEKLKQSVEIAKKDDGGGDKKEKDGGGDKKEKGGGDNKDGGGDKKEKGGDGDKKVEANKMEYHSYNPYTHFWPSSYSNQEHGSTSLMYNKSYYNQDYGISDDGYVNQGYVTEHFHGIPGPYSHDELHAPQMFSDENPNACLIM